MYWSWKITFLIVLSNMLLLRCLDKICVLMLPISIQACLDSIHFVFNRFDNQDKGCIFALLFGNP